MINQVWGIALFPLLIVLRMAIVKKGISVRIIGSASPKIPSDVMMTPNVRKMFIAIAKRPRLCGIRKDWLK
jgi:hypothetical protein